jgi:type VI secretion system protein ImpJ
MQDGLAFQMPEADPLPEARPIGSLFSPSRDSHTLYLALPAHRDEGRNFGESNGHLPADTRYVVQTRMFCDDASGRDERPVQLGRKNFRLLLDSELTPGMTALPVAAIRRDGSGNFVYDTNFIPPCIDIRASRRLMLMMRELVAAMEEKTRALEGMRQPSTPLAEHFRRDLSTFWFLHALHSSLGVLRHLLLARRGHPERLYLELARLSGSLCSFALDAHPRDLPLYDHERLTECFQVMENTIRRFLDLVVPVNVVTVPLQPMDNYFWHAAITDPRWVDRSRWILGIQSRAGEAAIIGATPQLVKVCSEKFIRKIVSLAMPGLPLTHLPVPPPEVPARVEGQYFGISKSGPCWEHIVVTKQIGIYVPGDLPNPELELIILLES